MRGSRWSSSAAPVTAHPVVLLGTETSPFRAEAADSIVAALASADRAEVPGRDHRWEAAGLADVLAASLPVSGGSGASRSS